MCRSPSSTTRTSSSPSSQSYHTLVFPVHYNGAILQFGFQSYTYLYTPGDNHFEYYTTNKLAISFAPLPPPNVTSIVIQSCDSPTLANQPAYYNCKPGVSAMSLRGSYMYELTVLVAGVPCVVSRATAIQYYCELPLLDSNSYTPGVQYPISIYNDAGNITQEATVSFTAQPTIATLVPCSDHAEPYLYASAYCQPGDRLTIVGSRFPTDDSTVQVILTSTNSPTRGPNANVSCLSASVQDSSTIVCTLPTLNTSIASSFVAELSYVRVLFNSATVGTNSLIRDVYDHPNVQVLTSITAANGACTPTNSPLQLSSCASNVILTITWQQFRVGY